MKKAIFIFLLIGILPLCESCKDKTLWMKFIGYTRNDIIGTYEASSDDSFYDDIPVSGNYNFKNASATITPLPDSLISFHIEFPEALEQTFTGLAPINGSDFLINLAKEGGYSLTSYVYHNDKNAIRLHGFVKITTPSADTLNNIKLYHFDLTKQ